MINEEVDTGVLQGQHSQLAANSTQAVNDTVGNPPTPHKYTSGNESQHQEHVGGNKSLCQEEIGGNEPLNLEKNESDASEFFSMSVTNSDAEDTLNDTLGNDNGISEYTAMSSRDAAIDSESETEEWNNEILLELLPSAYNYKVLYCRKNGNPSSFEAEFNININSEREIKQWVKSYNEISKETMVFGRKKNGKR